MEGIDQKVTLGVLADAKAVCEIQDTELGCQGSSNEVNQKDTDLRCEWTDFRKEVKGNRLKVGAKATLKGLGKKVSGFVKREKAGKVCGITTNGYSYKKLEIV